MASGVIDLDYLLINGRDLRVHGNGFLQIDLEIDGETGSERVHIFGHPALPRQMTPTPIHDHRFGFTSTVLKGRLINVTYDLLRDSEPTHQVYIPAPRQGEDTVLQATGERGSLHPVRTEVLLPGTSYSINFGVFHETLTNEITITHMRKYSNVSTHTPRVLCPIDKEPDNSFVRYDWDQGALWDIVRDAFA